MLIDRSTNVSRLIRRFPDLVEIFSWYGDLDPSDIDSSLTVEEFAIDNRLDVDTLVDDLQFEITPGDEAEDLDSDDDETDETPWGDRTDEWSDVVDDDEDLDEAGEDEEDEYVDDPSAD